MIIGLVAQTRVVEHHNATTTPEKRFQVSSPQKTTRSSSKTQFIPKNAEQNDFSHGLLGPVDNHRDAMIVAARYQLAA